MSELRKAQPGEKYCEFCGDPFPLKELDYLAPNNLICKDCWQGAEGELIVGRPMMSIHDMPPKWSISLAIDSHDWIALIWYRWHFSDDDGLMIADVYEWCLRRFWKIDRTP